MAIVISIANQKGGVGKTTSSIELGACFQKKGYKVLLIDLDQQANLSRYTSANVSADGIYNVLKGEADIAEAIQHTNEFDVLSASEELSKADKEFGGYRDALILKKSLRPINDIYDIILIDNNPARNRLLDMTYIASDYIIIPAEAEEGSIYGIRAIFKDLKAFKEDGFSDAEILGVILTKVEKTGMHEYGEEQIKEVLSSEDSDAFVMKVRKSIVANEVKSEGTSMQAGKKLSKPAADYRIIADEILKRIV